MAAAASASATSARKATGEEEPPASAAAAAASEAVKAMQLKGDASPFNDAAENGPDCNNQQVGKRTPHYLRNVKSKIHEIFTANVNYNRGFDGDQDSGVDENTQKPAAGRDSGHAKRDVSNPPSKANSRSRAAAGHRQGPRSKSVPKPLSSSSWSTPPSSSEPKKVPMNKIKVGVTQSPNLKQVKSKVGSLQNASHKPGGGEVKIEKKKLDWKAKGRTDAMNASYKPAGGDKKIENKKLEWNTASKVGSLQNADHKAGGGQVKIVDQKKVYTAQSKVGSMQNVKHKPGGGDKKVFNDVEYMRQISDNMASREGQSHSSHNSLTSSRRESGSQSPVNSPAAT